MGITETQSDEYMKNNATFLHQLWNTFKRNWAQWCFQFASHSCMYNQ